MLSVDQEQSEEDVEDSCTTDSSEQLSQHDDKEYDREDTFLRREFFQLMEENFDDWTHFSIEG